MPVIKGDELGAGTFGKVYKATVQAGQQEIEVPDSVTEVAIKCFFKPAYFSLEMEQVKKICTPALRSVFIEYYGSFTYSKQSYIVMELATTSLKAALTTDDANVSFDRIRESLQNAITILHRNSFAHRDIKPANILYSGSRAQWVLCDVGIAKAGPDGTQTHTIVGTDGYRHPLLERSGGQYTQYDLMSIDKFSAGSTLLDVFAAASKKRNVKRWLADARPGGSQKLLSDLKVLVERRNLSLAFFELSLDDEEAKYAKVCLELMEDVDHATESMSNSTSNGCFHCGQQTAALIRIVDSGNVLRNFCFDCAIIEVNGQKAIASRKGVPAADDDQVKDGNNGEEEDTNGGEIDDWNGENGDEGDDFD
jgi:serine/threonine protein kinase